MINHKNQSKHTKTNKYYITDVTESFAAIYISTMRLSFETTKESRAKRKLVISSWVHGFADFLSVRKKFSHCRLTFVTH